MLELEREKISLPTPFRVLCHVHSQASSRSSYGYVEAEHSYQQLARWVSRFLDVDVVVFTEHTTKPGAPYRVSEHDAICHSILQEQREVAELNGEGTGVDFLYGVEANILPSGQLDVPKAILGKLDVVIASRHGLPFHVEKDPHEVYWTLAAAMHHQSVHIIGHPNRYVDSANWPVIFGVALETGTAVEINLNEFCKAGCRLDTWEIWLKSLADSGAPVAVGIDFHNFPMFRGSVGADQDELEVGLNETWICKALSLVGAVRNAGIPDWRIVTSQGSRFMDWIHTPKKNRRELMGRWQSEDQLV